MGKIQQFRGPLIQTPLRLRLMNQTRNIEELGPGDAPSMYLSMSFTFINVFLVVFLKFLIPFLVSPSLLTLFQLPSFFVFLLGSTATPLQVMERGTAEVLKECLQRNAAVSPWIQAFRWRCRASCTDKAGYNLKADSSIGRDRGTQWAGCLTHGL